MTLLENTPELKIYKSKGNIYTIDVLDSKEVFDKKYDEIYNFCVEAINDLEEQQKKQKIDLSQTIKTMGVDGWENNNECLLFRIYTQQKYNDGKGQISLVYHNDKIVGLGGSELIQENVFSIAKRLFVLTPHRVHSIVTRFLIPSQYHWIKKYHPNTNLFIATFNLYLKNMIFRSQQKHKKQLIGGNESWNFWVEWKTYPNIIIMNYTKQYLIYYCSDNSIITHGQLREKLNLEEIIDEN